MIEKINLKPTTGVKGKLVDAKDSVLTIFENHIVMKQDYTYENIDADVDEDKIVDMKTLMSVPKRSVNGLALDWDSTNEVWSLNIETVQQLKWFFVEDYDTGKFIYDKLYKWLYS